MEGLNAIWEISVWTPMWEQIAERTRRNDPAKSHMTTGEIFDESIRERCPLGREQMPEDVGKTVAFFALDDAINVTAQSPNVNRGMRMD